MATYNTGNSALDNRLNYLDKTFGVDTSAKAKTWAKEIEEGKIDLDGLWRGLLRSRVGREGVEEWAEGIGVTQEEMDGVVDNLMSGERTFNQAVKKFGSRTGAGGTTGGTTDADPKTLPGVLAGGQTVRVRVDGQDRYYQYYEFPPGSKRFISYQFNDRAQAVATLGEDFEFIGRSPQYHDAYVLAEASAEEIVGLQGNFSRLSQEMMTDAAKAAGVRDPGLAGRIANNQEMQQIMAQAIAGDWTPAQVLAEQRKTSFWKNELYPGIDKFYNKTTDPERAWAEYRAQVSPQLRQLGYEPDADGTFNSQIKRMLDKNIDSNVFNSQVPTFIQATQNAEFAGVLNQWAESELGRNVEFNDWFDLMAGESQPELEAVAEKAQLAWTSQQQGAGITDAQVRDLADRTQMSAAEAQAVFADFNRQVLAVGQDGLARGGLTRDDILSAAAGLGAQDGRSVEEVRMQVAKIARENALFDDEKINFYVSFGADGKPQRPGLQSLAPEGA